VKVEPVVPELVVLNHFAPVIYHSCGKSSWKRCITSGVVGISAGIQVWDIPSMVIELYSGRDYRYRRRADLEAWWVVHGDEGSMFALKDKGNYTYLQYNARRYDKPVEVDSDVLHNILRCVKSLPFIGSSLLRRLYGVENYLRFLETIAKFPELTPLKLGENFVHHGLAFMLKLGLKADVKEHPASEMLGMIYDACIPRAEEVETFGAKIRETLHELTVSQEMTAKTYHERLILKAIQSIGLVKKSFWTDKYTVIEGMRDSVATLSRFVGNIFDR